MLWFLACLAASSIVWSWIQPNVYGFYGRCCGPELDSCKFYSVVQCGTGHSLMCMAVTAAAWLRALQCGPGHSLMCTAFMADAVVLNLMAASSTVWSWT